jgi:hypothetical protein
MADSPVPSSLLFHVQPRSPSNNFPLALKDTWGVCGAYMLTVANSGRRIFFLRAICLDTRSKKMSLSRGLLKEGNDLEAVEEEEEAKSRRTPPDMQVLKFLRTA